MSDYLIRLSSSKTASAMVRGLGLPVPLPQRLDRAEGPWTARPLEGEDVFIAAGEGAAMGAAIAAAAAAMGATAWLAGAGKDAPPGVRALDSARPPENARPIGLILDATGIETPAGLDALYDFFHPHVRGLAPCGRAIVVARPPGAASDPVTRAARRAIEGFVRSLGRELGRKGSTAQTVYVDAHTEERALPVLRFLLSRRSAYISGQPLHVTARIAAPPEARFERPLEGKRALVTGSARGIGAATARALAREGAHVWVMDRPEDLEAAQAVASEIGGSAFGCDITDPGAAARIREAVSAAGDGLDILVHNAGITRDKTLGNMDREKWDLVMAVNLNALIQVNEALRDLVRGHGRIVCLSSIGGISGNVGQTNYAASKAGVLGYVEALAETLAPEGVTVNAVAPGFIETRLTAAMPFGTREAARRLCNLSQGGVPSDIAEAIVFLASPGASGLTGGVLRVCGGNYIGA